MLYVREDLIAGPEEVTMCTVNALRSYAIRIGGKDSSPRVTERRAFARVLVSFDDIACPGPVCVGDVRSRIIDHVTADLTMPSAGAIRITLLRPSLPDKSHNRTRV